MKRKYFSLLGINTNFVHDLVDVYAMLNFHDEQLLKIVPNKLFIIYENDNNKKIAHHYYYQNVYLFSIAGIFDGNSWHISSNKIKISDIVLYCSHNNYFSN